jgi:hypothetical protein
VIAVHTMLAQAVLEKGMLDSASLGISNFVTGVGDIVQANPYPVIGVLVVVLFFLLRRRR